MVHLRVVAPREQAEQAHELLKENPLACHLVYLKDVVHSPYGDLLLVDVPREEASVIVGDLKNLGIPQCGSISVEPIDVQLSVLADRAEERAPGAPADAVVWEEVEARTSEESRLSVTYLAFMVLAALIAGVGILQDSSIILIGGMVVGPEFGPIAAFCVAFVEQRGRLAFRSLLALIVGFPLAIAAVWLTMLVLKAVELAPATFTEQDHNLSTTIANPDFLAFFIAFCAGMAGVLSLSAAKSGALIGVLVSVATIPSAANIAIAFVYQDWEAWRGSMAQLALNVFGILLAGTLTLWIQRLFYRSRRIHHIREEGGVASEKSPVRTRPRASSEPAGPRRP